MNVVRVNLGERSYEIGIGSRILEEVGRELARLCGPCKAALVTDENIEPLYAPRLYSSLEDNGFEVRTVVLPPGEDQKRLASAETLYDCFVDFGMDRKSLVVALGGGVIGDLSGFAAATYMRGIPFAQVPTTLLAQVDSSVGGKTAVDHARGKNLIGAFHQPVAVFIDVDVLQTLPPEEFRSGLVEIIKHGFIRHEPLLSLIEDRAPAIEAIESEAMTEIIGRSVEIKAAVVEADETEQGLRAILNYGHTVGHALEALTDYTGYRHGEAVAVGMMCAARIARSMDMVTDDDVVRHERILARFALPVRMGEEKEDDIVAQLHRDKKALAGKLRLVLLDRIGHAVVRDDVPEETIRRAISQTR